MGLTSLAHSINRVQRFISPFSLLTSYTIDPIDYMHGIGNRGLRAHDPCPNRVKNCCISRCTASKNASYLVVEYMQLDSVKHMPYTSAMLKVACKCFSTSLQGLTGTQMQNFITQRELIAIMLIVHHFSQDLGVSGQPELCHSLLFLGRVYSGHLVASIGINPIYYVHGIGNRNDSAHVTIEIILLRTVWSLRIESVAF